ncbi:MAG: isocitrate lyase [Gemmatimonadetes bacterium]|nr:MAG: isocitrate lyase [Gemmatimonadetes bacterium 13_2_20CM_2_66_5]PYP94737.1 MAG: isocitrate lyase [Gemmatimonadota bacterium]
MSTSTDLERSWTRDERWMGITRPYRADDVERLRGTLPIQYTLASHGATRLWKLMRDEPYVAVLSAVTGNQAVQEVRAGLKAIYISGWQVAADANCAMTMYPDQSLYPSDSVPNLICRIQNALRRADEIHHMNGDQSIDWYVPLVADAEAGFGGVLNAYELMKLMIAAGAAGVHFEDQLSSVKKCGHLGGKVLVPTSEFIAKLIAARLAADVCGVDTLLIARTDANSAGLLTSDIDEYDRRWCTGKRSPEGFFVIEDGVGAAIARARAYAPYADMLWFETAKPDLAEARQFAEAIHQEYPGKLLAYNCSPSFNWKRHLTEAQLAGFQRELGAMGYKFQFVTLSGFHALNHGMFTLAQDFRERGMAAYADLQSREFAAEHEGYEAVKHQEFVGVGYFDEITQIVHGGRSSTVALEGSTEKAQFVS